MSFYVVKTILKKLDLEDIIEKEMDLWNQKSKLNSFNSNVDELKTSNVLPTNSNNILTSKISETIQNIRIKKQKNFYTSQIHKREIKKPKTDSSKNEKDFPELFQQDGIKVILDEDSKEEDIFVNKSREKSNISVSLSTSSSISLTSPILSLNNSNSLCYNQKNNILHSPSLTPSDTRKLARMKLSAFKCNKNDSSSNSDKIESNSSASLTPQDKLNLSNIFSTGDEGDLSYLDID